MKIWIIKFELEHKINENKHLKLLGPEPLSIFFNFVILVYCWKTKIN